MSLRAAAMSCIAICLMLSTSARGQNEITNNQPVVGVLNKTETRIQAKITSDYHTGLIDSDQLAQFQRDFDGILDKENEFQSSRSGMNAQKKQKILDMLAAFEARLDKQAAINAPAPAAHQ